MSENAKNAGWGYKSDTPAKEQVNKAKTGAVSWLASEYIDHKQGPSWFLALAGGTVALAGVMYLLSKDYFGSGVVLMLGIIVAVFAKRTPRQLNYELSGDGLKIEQKLYPYALFKTFSIVQDGVLTSIDFMPVKKFMPPVSAYFDPADKDKIIAVLEQHLPYEERQLEAVERLTRRLHF